MEGKIFFTRERQPPEVPWLYSHYWTYVLGTNEGKRHDNNN